MDFVLQQQLTAGKIDPSTNRLHFLSSAESRYAIIELEMLAVVWTDMKCKIFQAGLQNFKIITDHNPLIPILNSH